MGTTSEKLTYLNGTKQKLKQAINNIGGEVTDETTFRNYVAELENAYDRLPKTEFEEGESVTLENTLKGKLDFQDGKVGFGQASQESTQGYNLLPLNPATLRPHNTQGNWGNDYTYTQNGITYTIDYSTGKIKASGTSTAVAVLAIPITLTQGNTYRISGCPSNGGANSYRAYIIDTSSFSQSVNDDGSGATLQSASYTSYEYRCRIANGYTANNIIFEPMAIDGSTAKTFEKYTGGYSSPSPNWEQQVKCVAGRNILKDSGWERKTAWNETQIQDSTTRIMSDYIEVDEHLNYYATIQSTSYCFGNVVLYNANKVQFATYYNAVSQVINGTRSIGLKFPTNTKYARFVVRNTDNISEVTLDGLATIKPMLEQGSTATPYLPYNTLEEVVRGINYCNLSNSNPESTTNIDVSINDNSSLLFDSNGETVQDSKNIFDSFTLPKVATLPKGDYTFAVQFIGDCNVSVNTIASYLKASASVNSGTYATCTNVVTITNGTIYATNFTLTEEKDVYLQVFTNSQNKKFTNTQMRFMIYSGSYNIANIPTYEPYVTPKTYQFSLGDHKFYGIGTYRDYILRTTGKNKFNGVYVNALTGGASPYPYTENNDCRSGIIQVQPNTTYTISKSTSNRFRVSEYSTQPQVGVNATNYIQAGDSATQYTLTTQNTTTYLLVQVTNEGQDNVRMQIEKGSTASNYQPYGVGNWYKFEKIGFYKITGQETIWEDSQQDRFAFNNLVDILHLQARQQIYCNRFQYVSSGSADYGMFAYWNGTITQVFIYDKDYTDPDDLKNYFANNETYFCYIRNTPVLTPITGTLAEQLEAWWNGQSLDGTTIIEGNGDLPMIIKVRALKGE